MHSTHLLTLFLMIFQASTLAFTPLSIISSHRDVKSEICSYSISSSRRTVLQKSAAALIASTLSQIVVKEPAVANVGEGDLPNSAVSFLKIVQLQRDWAAIGKTIREREIIDDEEWKNVRRFLRKMYQEGDTMKKISESFSEAKKKEASNLIDSIRSESKSADKVASSDNKSQFLTLQTSIESNLSTFMSLFQDVPDEL